MCSRGGAPPAKPFPAICGSTRRVMTKESNVRNIPRAHQKTAGGRRQAPATFTKIWQSGDPRHYPVRANDNIKRTIEKALGLATPTTTSPSPRGLRPLRRGRHRGGPTPDNRQRTAPHPGHRFDGAAGGRPGLRVLSSTARALSSGRQRRSFAKATQTGQRWTRWIAGAERFLSTARVSGDHHRSRTASTTWSGVPERQGLSPLKAPRSRDGAATTSS